MKSQSHKSTFIGIYDMNGIPICNGDRIRVHDKATMKKDDIVGTVIWKNGSYEFEGNHWCKYNIYAWRKSIEVLESGRTPIYDLPTMKEALDDFEHRNFRLIADKDELLKHYRLLIKKAFEEAYKMGLEHKTLQNEQG